MAAASYPMGHVGSRVSVREESLHSTQMEARDAIQFVKQSAGVSYFTDADGRILAVSPGWETFARTNDGSAIAARESLRGRDVRLFLEGDQVRAQFETLLKRVLTSARGLVSYPFRCDSGDTIRRMRLTMTRIEQKQDGSVAGVLFVSESVDAAHYDGHDFVLGVGTKRTEGPLQPICAYCLRLECPPASGIWIEHQDAEARGVANGGRLSHGACPDCLAVLMQELE